MVYALFFLTGAAGLIYEMSWSRQIGIFFGHTVNAAAVVLAVYFAGMALGYWLAGGLCARLRSPLLGYSAAEIAVGLWAIATPHVLALFRLPAVAALLNSPDTGLQTTARVLASFVVLLPATVALGATLPFVAQHLSRQSGSESGTHRSILAYALNTLGAVCGVLAASFYLILNLGVAGSSYLAAGISILCGLGAYFLASRDGAMSGTEPAVQQAEAGSPVDTDLAFSRGEILLLAAVSGFGTLALQVLYTRMFALVFHNSTYTFGGIVAVFLLALALGSWLAGRLATRYPLRRLISTAALSGALAILLSAKLLQLLTDGLQYLETTAGFWGYMFASLGLISAVVLLPVLLLGMQLPLAWQAARAATGELGRSVGRLTALNTVSAASGALLGSFALLPLLGIWRGVGLLAALYLACAALPLRKLWPRLLSLPLLLLLPPAAGYLLDPGLTQRAERLGYEYVYARDTPYGRIDVLRARKDGELFLRQNRHYTLGATGGGMSEVRQGLMPLLLHPREESDDTGLRVCYLGLATGITAGAALNDPQAAMVTSVELIPEVAEAAVLFSDYTNNVTHNPRSRIVVNDARYYLYATPEKYDVIVSDLFVPWHSQTGYLYTVEHYQAARERLAEGGIFCQWLPLYQLGPRELALIADSFAAVFPYVTVWRGDESGQSPILGLVGSEEPLRLNADSLREHIAGLGLPYCGADPRLATPEALASFYIGDWPAPAPGVPLNTDEHPRVEFLAPLSQRAGNLLSGERLESYEHEVLDKLPRGGFVLMEHRLR